MTKQFDKGPKEDSFERNMLETAKGGGFLAAGTFFEFGSRFVIAFVVARVLGAEQYGIYMLAISVATVMAAIATAGLDSTMVRYVAMQAGNRDEEGVWGTLQIGVGASFLVSALISLGLYFLIEPLASSLFDEPQLVPYLQLFCLFIPFMTLSSVMVDVARGFKRMDYSALAQNGVLFTTRLILVGILIFVRLDAFTAIIAFGLSEIAVSVSLVYLLNKQFPLRRPLRQARYEFREIFTFALPFWMSGILTKFRKNIQDLLLGTLNTVVSVGIFSIVSKINLVGHVVYASVVASVKPILAELQDRENWEEMRSLYQTTTRWTFTANLPIFLIMVLYPEQLLLVFGKSFTDGATALAVLALGELVNAGTGICGSIIDMTGRTKLKLANAVLWVALISVSNVLLIPQWGVLGAAVAAAGSIAVINFLRVLEVWILYRLLPYNATFLKPILAGLVAVLVSLIVGRLLPADTHFLIAVLHMLLVVVAYAGMLLLLGLAPEERKVLLRTYKQANGKLGSVQGAVQRYLTTRLGTR